MWKNIHVELEFLRLEFCHFIFSFFYAFFFLAFYFFPSSSFFDTIDLKTRSFNRPPGIQSSTQPDRLTQHLIIQSSLRSSSVLRRSRSYLFRFVLHLFFFRSFFLYSSSKLIFFKCKNRV